MTRACMDLPASRRARENLTAGQFAGIEANAKTGAVRVGLAAATKFTAAARLRLEQPAKLAGVGTYRPVMNLKSERDAWIVPLKAGITWIELTSK